MGLRTVMSHAPILSHVHRPDQDWMSCWRPDVWIVPWVFLWGGVLGCVFFCADFIFNLTPPFSPPRGVCVCKFSLLKRKWFHPPLLQSEQCYQRCSCRRHRGEECLIHRHHTPPSCCLLPSLYVSILGWRVEGVLGLGRGTGVGWIC